MEEIVAVLGWGAAAAVPAMRAARSTFSLDRLMTEDGDGELGDILPDRSATLPEDRVVEHIRAQEIRQVLGEVLTPREQEVLRMRFGLDGTSPELLETIGRRLGITRE